MIEVDVNVNATTTMTLALPKKGVQSYAVKENIGELYLVDISVPFILYSELNLKTKVGNIFAKNDIVRLS